MVNSLLRGLRIAEIPSYEAERLHGESHLHAVRDDLRVLSVILRARIRTEEQALGATTVAPAWLAGDERRRGKLVPGFLADLVVLDRDPFECEATELREVQVVATMVGGRWVHNPPPWD